MSYLLLLETSTASCSVAIAKNNNVIVFREIKSGYSHAENLLEFVRICLQDVNLDVSRLDAVAVSKGPGSYTGLRIGVSAAKGICFGHSIPLIGIETLKSMSAGILQTIENNKTLLCPLIDARRMEVYTSLFDKNLNTLQPAEALIINENTFLDLLSKHTVCFFGDGAAKIKHLYTRQSNAIFIDDFNNSAKHMTELAFQQFNNRQFENLAYFEPYYLKDFVGVKK